MKLHIGLSHAPLNIPKYGRYADAIAKAAKELGHEITVTDLSNNPKLIDEIDGIIFTGGSDVDPVRYRKSELRSLCEDINSERDTYEFEFAEKADAQHIPIFGICRGLQLLNVHYGGTLIVDLPTSGKPSHSKVDGIDKRHQVHLEPGRLIKKLSGVSDGSVTSAHHQAIDQIAPGMIVSAKSSDDGVIEAIEWNDQSSRAYFLAVQWHPERMEFGEPLAGRLFENFLGEVAMQKLLLDRIK